MSAALAPRERGSAWAEERDELEALLEDLHVRRGLDLRRHARAALRRHMRAFAQREELVTPIASDVSTPRAFRERLMDDQGTWDRFLLALATRDEPLFRQPQFFASMRDDVFPLLRTYPSIRVWLPNCGTGEDVYAVAIMLREAGLFDKAIVYATDASEVALAYADEGSYPGALFSASQSSYAAAGGKLGFDEYCTEINGRAVVRPLLRERVMFAQHALTSDASFNEFHLIVCRDTLIYFDAALVERAYGVFHESLCRFGVLAIGACETLALHPVNRAYEKPWARKPFYRRVGT